MAEQADQRPGADQAGLLHRARRPSEPPRLLGTKCDACGEYFYPRRAMCAKCMSRRPRTSSWRRAARCTATPSCTCRCSARPTWSTPTATASARSTCPKGRACRRRWPASRPSSGSGRRCEGELDVLREDGAQRHRDRALPAGGGARMRDVAVLGVGMHRFGAYYGEKPNAEMALVAGMAALRRCRPDVQATSTPRTSATSSPRS